MGSLVLDSKPQIVLRNKKEAPGSHPVHKSPLGVVGLLRGLIPTSTGTSGWPSECLQLDHVAVIQSFIVYALDQLPISIT